MDMTEETELSALSDEELVARFRETKSEGSGSDPGLTPPDTQDAIREEMERRGLAPDREDIVPDIDSGNGPVDHDPNA
jgi:hypothetical protein